MLANLGMFSLVLLETLPLLYHICDPTTNLATSGSVPSVSMRKISRSAVSEASFLRCYREIENTKGFIFQFWDSMNDDSLDTLGPHRLDYLQGRSFFTTREGLGLAGF